MADEHPIAPLGSDARQAGAPPEPQTQLPGACLPPAFICAAAILLVSGLILFGWDALRIAAICVVAATVVDALTRAAMRRGRRKIERHAIVVGMLTACTLPPTVDWLVPLIAAGLAVLAGQMLRGKSGHNLWQPVALARVLVQMLFAGQLSPQRWPVLAPGHLLWGNLDAARLLPAPATWAWEPLPCGVQAWNVLRPADVLAAAVPAHGGASPSAALAALVRDLLPPWSDTLTGVAGGAIGEACGLAVITAGLLLIWRGWARWTAPLAGVLVAGILAAVLPVAIRLDSGQTLWHWLPGAVVHARLPVGLVYCLYHLTAGEFLLVLMVLAADPASSPRTTRGYAVFGGIVGALTIGLRVLTGVPAAGYWALLAATTTVPLINRASRLAPAHPTGEPG